MKRLFFSTLALLLCGAIGAADNTATIQLRVTALTGNKTDMLNLFENESYSEAFVQGEDSKKMGIDDATKVFIYTIVGTNICANKGTNNLDGTGIVVKTNSSPYYKFTVPYVAGTNKYLLLDKDSTKYTPVTSTMVYQFAAPSTQSIRDRFYLVKYTPDPGELAICHQVGKLVITNNPYTDNIVVKDDTGAVVIDQIPLNTPQTINLSSLTPGKYKVEMGNGAKSYIIIVQP